MSSINMHSHSPAPPKKKGADPGTVSDLTPMEQAWLDRLGLGHGGTPPISPEDLAKLVVKLGKNDQGIVLQALKNAGHTTYASEVEGALDEAKQARARAEAQKTAEPTDPNSSSAPDLTADPTAKVDVVPVLEGKKAKAKGKHNIVQLYPHITELKGPATVKNVKDVASEAKNKLETDTTLLPPQLNVSGSEKDATVRGIDLKFDKPAPGKTVEGPFPAQSAVVTSRVAEKVTPLHLEQSIKVITKDLEWRKQALKDCDPIKAQWKGELLDELAEIVGRWQDSRAREGFDLLLQKPSKRFVLADKLKKAGYGTSGTSGFDKNQEKLTTYCAESFLTLSNPEASTTKLAVVADVHGSHESIADRMLEASRDPLLIQLMGLVKKGDRQAALDLVASDKDLADRYIELQIQFTGDLTSKGSGTLDRFKELAPLDELRVAAKKKSTGDAKATDEGIGFVYGNHEFSLAMFLRAPETGKFYDFFGGWLIGKQGYQLLEGSVDTKEYQDWIAKAGLTGKSFDEIAKSDEEIPGTKVKFSDVDKDLQKVKDEAAKALLGSDKKAVVGWAYMKYQLFDPNAKTAKDGTKLEAGAMGKFLFDKHCKVLEVRKVAGKAMLFSHGDLSGKMITRLKQGMDPAKGSAFNTQVLEDNVAQVNGEFRAALMMNDEKKRQEELAKVASKFGDELFKVYFAEFYHAEEGGAKKGSMQADFKEQMDFLALAGISGHFSGHTPQVAQSGTQTKAQREVNVNGIPVVVDDFKIDVDEFGEGGSASGNVVTVDEEGNVFGNLRDGKGDLKVTRLGKLGQKG